MFRGQAEDADRFRPYFRFHSGDVEPIWGVDDHWSLGLGANLNRHLGVELAFDYYLQQWGEQQDLGEASSYHLVPEVRLRQPLLGDRLVPYVVAGIGPSWIQTKDVWPWAFSLDPYAEGFTFTVAAGAGVEYFIADNVTFGLEGRYLWVQPIDGRVGNHTESVDLSAPLLTFGLRVFFDENRPQPFVTTEANPPSRLYFGVRMGGNILTDGNWVPGVTLRPEGAAWGGQASQTGGLLLGYDMGPHLSAEISGDHINHDVDVDGLGGIAEYGQGYVMGNVRFRQGAGRWSSYLYAGGGINYGEFKDGKPPGRGLNVTGGGISPAFNVGAGVEYFIVRNFSIGGDVRWVYTWDNSFGIDGILPERSGDLSHVAATLGFHVYLLEGRKRR